VARELLNFLDGEADHYFYEAEDAMLVVGDVEIEVEGVSIS
jgi:hypothetical protein